MRYQGPYALILMILGSLHRRSNDPNLLWRCDYGWEEGFIAITYRPYWILRILFWTELMAHQQMYLKNLGDAAFAYVTIVVCDARRLSNLTYELPAEYAQLSNGLDFSKIKMLCPPSVFLKSKRFESTHSQIYRTRSSALKQCITGQSCAATIHEQSITWEFFQNHSEDANPFNISTILVHCTCKYFKNTTCIKKLV